MLALRICSAIKKIISRYMSRISNLNYLHLHTKNSFRSAMALVSIHFVIQSFDNFVQTFPDAESISFVDNYAAFLNFLLKYTRIHRTSYLFYYLAVLTSCGP